jgi:hypothetical protein
MTEEKRKKKKGTPPVGNVVVVMEKETAGRIRGFRMFRWESLFGYLIPCFPHSLATRVLSNLVCFNQENLASLLGHLFGIERS